MTGELVHLAHCFGENARWTGWSGSTTALTVDSGESIVRTTTLQVSSTKTIWLLVGFYSFRVIILVVERVDSFGVV